MCVLNDGIRNIISIEHSETRVVQYICFSTHGIIGKNQNQISTYLTDVVISLKGTKNLFIPSNQGKGLTLWKIENHRKLIKVKQSIEESLRVIPFCSSVYLRRVELARILSLVSERRNNCQRIRKQPSTLKLRAHYYAMTCFGVSCISF